MIYIADEMTDSANQKVFRNVEGGVKGLEPDNLRNGEVLSLPHHAHEFHIVNVSSASSCA